MCHKWRPTGEHTTVPLGEARSKQMGKVSPGVCMTVQRVAMWLWRRRLCLVQTTERLCVPQQVLSNSLVCACH